MNCEGFTRQMDELSLQHGAQTPVELQAHGESCAQCRQAWSDYQRLASAIRVWRHAVPAVNLTDRVVADLGSLQTVVVRPMRWQQAFAVLAGTAATVALGVWLALPPAVAPVRVADSTAPAAVDEGVDLTQSVASLWEEMRVPAASLPEPSLPRLPRVGSVWAGLASVPESATAVEPKALAGLDSGGVVEPERRAPFPAVVRDRVTSAFSFLGQTLPDSPQG